MSEIVADLTNPRKPPLVVTEIRPAEDLVQAGREALSRHSWSKAFEYLQRASAAGELTPEDLEQFAEAAWWTGKTDRCCQLLERAYAGHLRAGQPRRAALTSVKLAELFYHKAARSVSGGWLKRAERLLVNAEDAAVTSCASRLSSRLRPKVMLRVHCSLRKNVSTLRVGLRTRTC
jgi:hypothetical protein